MTDISVHWTGVDELVASIEALAAAGGDAALPAARAMALSFTARAKKNATGPARIRGKERRTRARKGQPSRTLAWRQGGPGVVTGFMRGSIGPKGESGGAGHAEVTVHPLGPYYRRLEFGFTGTDSIGRKYAQPAYPFLRPALDFYGMNQMRKAAIGEFRKAIKVA